MTMTRLFGRAFISGAIQDDSLITIRDGVIVDVAQSATAPAGAIRTSGVIAPGFIDVHVHGGDGSDFMDADPAANARILEFHARNGTTALAATTLSAAESDLRAATAAIAHSDSPHGAEICGIHLEGPYINPSKSGAQDRSSIRPPSIRELGVLVAQAPKLSWMMTIAPEIEGARELIEAFRGRVKFSIGHTNATHAEAAAGLAWGASHFTHLFNAMTPLQHREPGVVGAALSSSDATAEVIADGIHVHPAALRVAVKAMPNRIVLITDAIRACGMPDGKYKLYNYDITVADGAARLNDGNLAGSILTMRAAVENMVTLAALPLELVLPLATEVPAAILNVQTRKGRIARGYDADIVVLDEKFRLEQVILRGTLLPSS